MIRPNLTAGNIAAALLGAGTCTLALYAVFGVIGTDPRLAFVCGAIGAAAATLDFQGRWRYLSRGLAATTLLYLCIGWALGGWMWYHANGGWDCSPCLYTTFVWGFIWALNFEWLQLWQLIWEWAQNLV